MTCHHYRPRVIVPILAKAAPSIENFPGIIPSFRFLVLLYLLTLLIFQIRVRLNFLHAHLVPTMKKKSAKEPNQIHATTNLAGYLLSVQSGQITTNKKKLANVYGKLCFFDDVLMHVRVRHISVIRCLDACQSHLAEKSPQIMSSNVIFGELCISLVMWFYRLALSLPVHSQLLL